MVATHEYVDPSALEAFIALVGARHWRARITEISRESAAGTRAGKAILQRHAIELIIETHRKPLNQPSTVGGSRILQLAAYAARVANELTPQGRDRFRASLRRALDADETLVPSFHLLRTAVMQRERGFDVSFPGFDEAAPFDLLLARDGAEAEIACDVVSAEDGRGVHRGAWFRLADLIDPDLQVWLAAHPGRYLLKMTLPQGLRGGLRHNARDGDSLAMLHQRIQALLNERRQTDQDAGVVLRLDPLLLAGAQAGESRALSRLRSEFGPEAHLAVTASGGGVFVMAARASRENEVATAVRRRMAAVAPARLTGARPGILAMFIEDTDRIEWRGLRDQHALEGEARQFLTLPQARPVVAVTCTTRHELFGIPEPDAAPDGELRFRNPAHPAAKAVGLAPAVLSSM